MSLVQVKEVLPQLNSRSQGGRVIVNPASGLDGELTVRPSEDVVICCGRAYLSVERLQAHQEEGNCSKYPAKGKIKVNMPPPPPPALAISDQDPLGDYVEEEDGRDNESVPIINFVGSIRAEDIDDIDIFEEEPRALIDNNGSSSTSTLVGLSTPTPSRRLSQGFPSSRPYRYDERRLDSLHVDEMGGNGENSWLDIEDVENEEDEEEAEFGNVQSNHDEWDELEEVEVYGGSDVYEVESKAGINPNLHVEAAYSETGSSSVLQGSDRPEIEGKYKCNVPSCVYSTVTEKNLRIHLQNAHDPSSIHVCDSCVCRYKSKSELTRHMKMCHGQFHQVIAVPEIVRVVVNGKNKFKCKACGYTCRSEQPLKIHVHAAHDPNGKFRCSFCVCQYSKGNQLTQHVAMHHKDKLTINPLKSRLSTTTTPASIAFISRPKPITTTSYAWRSGPQQGGSRTSTPATFPDKNATVALIRLETESGTVEVKKVVTNNYTKYECKLCSYCTPKKSAIICHAKGAHVPHGKFPCPYCACCYNSSGPYHAHVNRSHPDKPKTDVRCTPSKSAPSPQSSSPIDSPPQDIDSPAPAPAAPPDSFKLVMINGKVLFKCEACNFMARDMSLTDRHIHNSHGPTARYFCRHCTHRFSHHGSLALHITRIHPEFIERVEETEEPRMELVIADGFKIYRCKLCLYVIPIESKCLSHVVNSHRPDGEHKCDMCSCRFLQSGSLSTHKSIFHRDLDRVNPVSSPPPKADPVAVPKSAEIHKKKTPVTYSVISSLKKAKARNPNSGFVRFSTKFVNGKRWFFCNACEQSTTKETSIKLHVVAAHNPANRFKCRKCSCRYAQKGRLTVHIATKHKVDLTMPVLSPKVPIPTGRDSPINGMVPFQCDKCPYSTDDESLMESHNKNSHLPSNMYPCNLCCCRFPSNTMLLQHLTIDHDNAGFSSTSTSSNKKSNASSASAPMPIKPTSSVTNFVGYNKIVRDGRVSYKCTHPNCSFEVVTSSHIRHHVGSAHDPDRSLCCGHCSCRFGSQGRLNKHLKEYHGIDVDETSSTPNSISSTPSSSQTAELENKSGVPFAGIAVLKCQISGCGFETQPQYEAILEDHMKSAHSPKAKFKCEQCPCRFNNKTALTQHENSTHGHLHGKEAAQEVSQGQENESGSDLTNSPGISFQCKFCDFSTKNKPGFITHLTAAHSAKNPHQCSKCCCRFATIGGLTSHEYKSHNKTVKKKQIRPTLKTHTGLLERMQTATATSNSSAFQKPAAPPSKHSCTLCLSSFNNPSSLNWHMIRVHTERNPDKPTFSCELCGNNYDTDKGLFLHKKKSHRMDSSTDSRDVETSSGGGQPDPGDSALVDAGDAENLSPLRARIAAKAARKYAEIEGPDDLPSDSDNDDDLFVKKSVPKTDRSKSQPIEDDVQTKPISPKSSKRQCSKCSYSSDPSLVAQHEERAHVENGHQCSYCVCSFRSLASLRKHTSLIHTKKERGLGKNNVTNHIHNTRSSITPQVSLEESETTPADEEPASNTEENDTTVPVSTPSTDLDENSKQTGTDIGTHQCPLCSFTCRLAVNFTIHQLSAHVKGGYLCKYCTCSYRTTFGLDSHLKLRHKKHISVGQAANAASSTTVKVEDENGEFVVDDKNDQQLGSSDLLQCTKCSFSTKLNINLATHMKIAHLGNHHCKKCNRSFKTQSILDKHNLDVHKERSVSPPLDDDPDLSLVKDEFTCPECPFTTSLRMKLKQHEKKHKQNMSGTDESPAQVDLDDVKSATGSACDIEEVMDENSRKRRNSDDTQDTLLQSDSVEPKAKQRKVVGKTSNVSNPLLVRTRTRRSAEVARKVISSVIQSEQLSDGEETDNVLGEGSENDGAIGEPQKKKARVETITSENSPDPSTPSGQEEVDHSTGIKESKTSETGGERTPRAVRKSKTRHSLKEVATLQRATERIALNARHSKEPSKRAAGLREFMKFTCSRCALTFDTVMKLTSHYERCEEKFGDFQCGLCDSKYVSLLKLKEHIWKSHMLEEDKQKSEATTSKSPLGHPYVCPLCKLGIKERRSYILHMSLPHLFRCKKCVFVCGTKTAMDKHKKTEHKKQSAVPVQDPENDDILVVYDSAAPAAHHDKALGTKTPHEPSPTGIPSEKSETNEDKLPSELENDSNTLNGKDEKLEDANAIVITEASEPETESLICVECGYFSETLEEAREHNEAALNIESLICSICGKMATSGCDSIIHFKTHQDDEDDTEFVSPEQDGTHEITMKDENETTIPGYKIEFEFKEGCPLQTGIHTVEVPLTEGDGSNDPNQVLLFELKDLDPTHRLNN